MAQLRWLVKTHPYARHSPAAGRSNSGRETASFYEVDHAPMLWLRVCDRRDAKRHRAKIVPYVDVRLDGTLTSLPTERGICMNSVYWVPGATRWRKHDGKCDVRCHRVRGWEVEAHELNHHPINGRDFPRGEWQWWFKETKADTGS